jgi:exoribonuclease II
VQKAYRNKTLNRSNVSRWYLQFRDGRELVNNEKSDRLKSTRTEVNIAAIAADLVKNNRRIASRMIAESLNIPKPVVLRILKEDFCSRDIFLLHDNASSHKAAIICQFLTQKIVTNPYNPRTLQVYHRQNIFCSPS